MPYTVEQAKSTIPHVTDERVSITHRDNQNTEKCDATLTWWIGAFVPKSRPMKAPRTLPEAESVFLLSSPNTVLKIYHSYIRCPELTTKKAHNSRQKRNPMMVQCNSTSHQHLNIRSHKKYIQHQLWTAERGLIEWTDRLGFSFIFLFYRNQIQLVSLAFTGRKQKKMRWFWNRRGEETSHLTGSFHTLGSVFELCQQILERKINHWSFSTGSEDNFFFFLNVRFNCMLTLKPIKAFLCGASTYAQLMHPLNFILM